jgi:hypothetical protein
MSYYLEYRLSPLKAKTSGRECRHMFPGEAPCPTIWQEGDDIFSFTNKATDSWRLICQSCGNRILSFQDLGKSKSGLERIAEKLKEIVEELNQIDLKAKETIKLSNPKNVPWYKRVPESSAKANQDQNQHLESEHEQEEESYDLPL